MKKSLQVVKAIFKAATTPVENIAIDKLDDELSPNMRALRLSIQIADTLIAMGVPTADVVSMSLDVTDRYCQRKVYFDISSNLITASQDRGNNREPLTLVRHASTRTVNNMTVQTVQDLVRDIVRGNTSLEQAEERMEYIKKHPRKYPRWLSVTGGALISTGAGILFGASPIILCIMFILGAIVSYAIRILAHKRFPIFFTQIISAITITLTAALISWLDTHEVIPWLNGTNATLILIGGIIMLVAGLATVAAVQDSIDEFYVTANARLLKVAMMTMGVVAGVLIGMYIAKQFSVYIELYTAKSISQGYWYLIGAAVISAGYALSTQTHPFGVMVAGILGTLSIWVYSLIVGDAPLSLIMASGIAAASVGIAATLFSRLWRTPSNALMNAGIVPLVPGLTLYNGLFQLVGNSTNTYSFDQGILVLFNAILIALAIASGVTLGHLVARPIRRSMVRARNSIISS
jgi:uncharacterized membrane protein YjjP (DUF1212 family)